jgi:Fe-S-cluster-containing dehydrogenase component
MAGIIKVRTDRKCIGCELCVMEVQRQLQKIGLEGSPIRIFRNSTPTSTEIEFTVELDPNTSGLDLQKVVRICPTSVFEITKEDSTNELGS